MNYIPMVLRASLSRLRSDVVLTSLTPSLYNRDAVTNKCDAVSNNCTDKSKIQENSQNRANTDTRIRRIQKEAKDTKPKPEKSSLIPGAVTTEENIQKKNDLKARKCGLVSTPSSTNDVNTSNVHVSTASSSLSTASTTDNTARLSDATINAFLSNQPNGSQVVHEDLKQIHEDDLKEMDLKCDTAGYDKTKVECFNWYKLDILLERDGYNAVAPPPTGLFAPPTIDLSNSGLEEFKQPEFEGYGVKVNKSVSENSSNEIKKTFGAPIIEDWVSNCDEVMLREKVNSVNTVKRKRVISVVREQGINASKSTACWVWRPKIKVLDHVSKNNGSYTCKQFDYVDPTGLEFKDKKELAIPGQTTTGKEFSNPLMADSLPKTILSTKFLG
ncbi:hypothetical protein Tco_0066984 [Tanacetum coccineum]